MISKPLLFRNMQQIIKPLLIFIAVLSMYTSVIVYMYDPSFSDMLNNYQTAMPEVMSAFGMTGIATSLLEFMKVYLYGFLMLVFPMIFIVIINNMLIMKYIDRGSMASLIATPNSRRKIIVTQGISIVLSVIMLMCIMTGIGILCGEIMFSGELDIPKYISLNFSTLLLQLVIAGISFLAACIVNESKYYYAFGVGIPLLFFLINMLSNMGEKLENLKYFTIYSLLRIDDIVKGTGNILGYNIALIVIFIVLFFIGIRIFTKRDLPL
ncbi:MAG: ABC transporter permease subunit [Clostridiales bacterium]|nr:ABC transporter permease subunit [Clostridiales bacterium]